MRQGPSCGAAAFNDAVLEAVYIMDRRIGRAEFTDVFAPLLSRPSSNEALKVDPARRCVNRLPLLQALQTRAVAWSHALDDDVMAV
jgi:hypothetical protein